MKRINSNISPRPAKFWFALDNAAKIFPAVINSTFTAVFRITAVQHAPVQISALRNAVLLAEKRYPFFSVMLKEGFFWYYLEYLPEHFPVEVDGKPYCRKFPKNGHLVRIRVRDNRISAEFSHILTDGGAGLEFLKTVLNFYAHYIKSGNHEAIHLNQESHMVKEEYEDAYKRYFKAEVPPMIKKSKAFHLPYKVNSPTQISLLNAVMPVSQVRKAAAEKGVSITVYFVAVYLYILQEIAETTKGRGSYKNRKTLRVQVPINLRRILPSQTMRNFSLFIMPEIDLRLGHYTFDEIVKSVYHQTQLESDEKLINKNISRNVGSEKKLYIRSIPLFLKSLILRMKYFSLGTSQYSGVVTNLGNIELPENTAKTVDYFIMTPPPPNKVLKLNCGIAGFGDKLVLCFNNITQSHEFEEKFLKFLEDQNFSVNYEKI